MELTRVKICGMMDEEDIHLCARSGADALGFVIEYPVEVPWNISRERALELIAKAPPFVTTVAVVGGDIEHILSIADLTLPDMVQLHGNESLDETGILVRELSRRGIRVVKALRINVDEEIRIQEIIEDAREIARIGVSALLLDSKTSRMPAGTGVLFSWEIARKVRHAINVPLIIAGGLNPENVCDAIKSIRPFAVDVISGVEDEPGKKNRHKVEAFIQSVSGSLLLR